MTFLSSPGVATAVPARAAAGCGRAEGVPVALRATTAPAVTASAATMIPVAITRAGGEARRTPRRRLAPGWAVIPVRGVAMALARSLALRSVSGPGSRLPGRA